MARKCFFNAAHTGIVSYPVACTDDKKHYVCYDCQEHAPCDNDNRLDVTFKQKMQNGKFYCFDIRQAVTESNICDDIEIQMSQEDCTAFTNVLCSVLSYLPCDIKLIVHQSPYCFSDNTGDFDGFYDDDTVYLLLNIAAYENKSYEDAVYYRGINNGEHSLLNDKHLAYAYDVASNEDICYNLWPQYREQYQSGFRVGFDTLHRVLYRHGLYVENVLMSDNHAENGSRVLFIQCQEAMDFKLYRVEWKDNRGCDCHQAFSFGDQLKLYNSALKLFNELTTPKQEDDNDMHEDINTESLPAIDEPSFYQLEEHDDKLSINIEENAQAASSKQIVESMSRRFITGISTLIFAVILLVTCFAIMGTFNQGTSYAATCKVHKYAHKAGYYAYNGHGTTFYASPPAGCIVYNGRTDSGTTSSVTPVATSTASSTPVTTSSHKNKHRKSHTSSNAGSNAGSTSTSTASSSGNNAVCTFDIATNGTHQRSCNGTSITIDVHVKPHHKQD